MRRKVDNGTGAEKENERQNVLLNWRSFIQLKSWMLHLARIIRLVSTMSTMSKERYFSQFLFLGNFTIDYNKKSSPEINGLLRLHKPV